MKLTAQVKLAPTPDQAAALTKTLETANRACTAIAAWAWQHQTFGQYAIHQGVYREVKVRFGLTAQMGVRCIAKVADAYKLDRTRPRTFKRHGSIAYDDRILRWYLDQDEVSIWADGKRHRMPFVCGERQHQLLRTRQGESDLVLVKGTFYLLATCTVIDPSPADVTALLGVDLGITEIATTSDGPTFGSVTLSAYRLRRQKVRKSLQAKGNTRSRSTRKNTRRVLKGLSGKERRYQTWINHTISKQIVETAKDTGRGIALEDLTGIRARTTVRKSQRGLHTSWAFAQLRAFIEYKAALAGVVLVVVDPRYTSQTCAACFHLGSRHGKAFVCSHCGRACDADLNGAQTIAAVGAAVIQPEDSPLVCALPERMGQAAGSSPSLQGWG
ncbi:MAG: IS200/IS605 family element transposase accessory protein TnpB [Candidatus Latescibacteria bacterium]|nr:IS200/IS605 family element transposase accessory protein TnpB [Candidatus Latescibacterota bacterium]